MTERLINIFVFGDATHVHAVGWRVYEKAGTYDELTAFLRSRVQQDYRVAARNALQEPILRREFNVMDRLKPIAGMISEAGFGENCVYCITHVVNGEVQTDDTFDSARNGAIPDYLKVYSTERGFDFPQLINDDYFEAIHLLWNNKKYVSCLKLVFSAIDTFGFVEYGPDGGNCFADG